jgi:hypothetical protein
MSSNEHFIGNHELLQRPSQLEEVVTKLTYSAQERWRIKNGILTENADTHLTAHFYVEEEGLKGSFPEDEDQSSKTPFDVELLYRPNIGQIFLFGDTSRDKMQALPIFCARNNIKPTQMLARLEQLHKNYDITSQKVKVVSPIVLPNGFVEDKYPPSILLVARNHDPMARREVYGLDQYGNPFGYNCQYNPANDAIGDILSGVSLEPIPTSALHYSSPQY